MTPWSPGSFLALNCSDHLQTADVLRFRVLGLGALGFRVLGLGALGFRVLGLGALGFRV